MCFPLCDRPGADRDVNEREAPVTPEIYVELTHIEVRLFGGSLVDSL
jgi:hypothetical protein